MSPSNRDNSVYEVVEDRPLTANDRAAGVISDQIVWLGCQQKRGELKQKLRVIKVKCTPHLDSTELVEVKRIHNGRAGPQQGEFLLIVTSLLELPAEVIALIYKCRWGVETVNSMIKRNLDSTMRARTAPRRRNEMLLRVITHNLMILQQG